MTPHRFCRSSHMEEARESTAGALFIRIGDHGAFRRVHAYATTEQRREQNQDYRSYLLNALSAERIP